VNQILEEIFVSCLACEPLRQAIFCCLMFAPTLRPDRTTSYSPRLISKKVGQHQPTNRTSSRFEFGIKLEVEICF